MFTVYLALFGWIPAVLLLYLILPPRRAMLAAFVAGWLLLPPVLIYVPGLPDYGKYTATGYAVLLATAIFQPTRLLRLRPRWYDLPMLAFVVTPFFSILSNDMTAETATSAMIGVAAQWGVPYLLGRAYLDDEAGLREAAIAVFLGGLAYVLPCLFELRFSAVLMHQVYGIIRGFEYRFGGYRPRVFLSSGLELGMWMTAATLAGYALWSSGALGRPVGRRLGPILAGLLAVTILCRATGALLLLAVGLAIFWGIRRTGRVALLWPLILAIPLYETTRVTKLWSGQQLHGFVSRYSLERAQSLEFRLKNEDILIAHALKRPLLGWGNGVRNRVYDENGRDISITDGCWILMLGYYGLIGLASWTAMMITPGILVARRCRASWLTGPVGGPALGLALIWLTYGIDCLANDMNNQVYAMAAGGIAGVVGARRRGGRDDGPGRAGDGGAAGDERTARAAAHEARAAALAAADRPEEADLESRRALGLLEAVRADRPDDPGAWEGLALGYEAFARALESRGAPAEAAPLWDRAVAVLDEAEARFPGAGGLREAGAAARNDAAWALVRQPARSPAEAARAVRLAEQALERAPRDASAWNTLGAAYLRAGDPGAAVAAVERGQRLGGRESLYDPFLLALAHHQLGMTDAARSWRDRGLARLEAVGRDAAGAPADLLALRDEVAALLNPDPALAYSPTP